jgi:hypothetical protein
MLLGFCIFQSFLALAFLAIFPAGFTEKKDSPKGIIDL